MIEHRESKEEQKCIVKSPSRTYLVETLQSCQNRISDNLDR